MGRPSKDTVTYYPHYVRGGRTIFILESKYGNDGYAFWFKLLEILGDSEGHYYDCSIPNNWAYLIAKTRCDEETAMGIINTLLSLDKIDAALWNANRIIWCQSFVDNVSSVYKMRRAEIPNAPSFPDGNPQGVSVSNNVNHEGCGLIHKETDIVEYSIVEKSKEENRIYPYQDIVTLWNEICGGALPKVKALNDKRRKKIKCRLDESEGKNKEEYLEHIKTIFYRVIASDFLRGINNSGWTATFDWLFENSENWVKVVEGNYDNDRGIRGKQQVRGWDNNRTTYGQQSGIRSSCEQADESSRGSYSSTI